MAAVPRNAPCPCGSGLKYKRCCIEREEELERHAEAAEELLALAQAFPLFRPCAAAVEAWAQRVVDVAPTRELVEAGLAAAGAEECDRIVRLCSTEYEEMWERLVTAYGDETEAARLLVVGGLLALVAEPRDLDKERLAHVAACPGCSSGHAEVLAAVLDATDLWGVADAAALESVLDELDDDDSAVAVAATAAELWTDAHAARLDLLVARVRERLPASGHRRASQLLAAACERFSGDERVRERVAALLLADTLGPLRSVALALRRAA